jgi:predicted O-linked N-acetylglucosamine transferase (SPINDLY family)
VQLHQAGRLADAERAARQALALDPRHPGALHLVGLVNLQAKQAKTAVEFITAAVAADPGVPHFHNNLGTALRAMDRLADAEVSFRRAIALRPGYARALINLAQVQQDGGNLIEARANFARALAAAPNDLEALWGLGVIHHQQGALEDAAEFYARILRIAPDTPEALQNFSGLRFMQGRTAEGVELLQRYLKLQPVSPEGWQQLAVALESLAQLTEAVVAYRNAIAQKPDYADAHNGLGNSLSKLGLLDEAIASYREGVRLAPDALDIRSNLIMTMASSPEVGADDILREARAYAARVEPRPTPAFANTRVADRPLRVGYVSADLRDHPVGHFFERVLDNHDRARFEPFLYSDVRFPDALTARLRESAAGWREIARMRHEDVVRLIQGDRIDILVDLSGHTGTNRLAVFGARAAPVQASWLGYFGTTGLASMDYVIGDEIVLAPGDEAVFSEKLVRLAHPYLCWSPPRDDAALVSPPAFANGYVTFGCFNNRTKITADVVAVWAEILKQTQGAHLFLKTWSFADEGARDLMRAQFAAHGVAADRLRFEGLSPRAEGLAAYNQIDIALDPFPFGGCTTTADTLWMGVPVVALDGARWSGRMSRTILTTIGLEQWAAPDRAAYVALAARAANDLASLASLRAGLRDRVERSSFCDGPAFAARLEAAYRTMWRAWADPS